MGMLVYTLNFQKIWPLYDLSWSNFITGLQRKKLKILYSLDSKKMVCTPEDCDTMASARIAEMSYRWKHWSTNCVIALSNIGPKFSWQLIYICFVRSSGYSYKNDTGLHRGNWMVRNGLR